MLLQNGVSHGGALSCSFVGSTSRKRCNLCACFRVIFNNDPDIRRVLMQLINGTYSSDTELFRPLYNSLLNTQSTSKADTYFILKDFKSYADARAKIVEYYENQSAWAKSAILNVACSGKFTSDRTIQQYVDEIWHLDKVVLKRKAAKTEK